MTVGFTQIRDIKALLSRGGGLQFDPYLRETSQGGRIFHAVRLDVSDMEHTCPSIKKRDFKKELFSMINTNCEYRWT